MFEIVKKISIQLQSSSTLHMLLIPIISEDDVEKIINSLKKEHPDAFRFSYAWRILKDNGQVYIKRSDDGEPTGSSGAPMLTLLTDEGLVNTLCCSVRYAAKPILSASAIGALYKKGLAKLVKNLNKVKFTKKNKSILSAPIKHTDKLLKFISENQLPIVSKNFTHEIMVTVMIPEHLDIVVEKFISGLGGHVTLAS